MKTRFILLTLACLLAAAPATAQVNYNISAIGSVVTRSPNASGDIVIASTYLGDTVTWIVGCAFCGCTNLTSVTIPYGATHPAGARPGVSRGASRTNNTEVPANT